MYVKIRITGKIEVLTGMHIGGSSAFSAIGAVDSPIIKDFRTGDPMIPGSSLKGKMRSLLARKHNSEVGDPNKDALQIRQLFGSSAKNDEAGENDATDKIYFSKLIFSDTFLSNWDVLKNWGAESKTEIKFENSISRTTGVANPRQIERAIRGSVFPLDIIYEYDGKSDIQKDFELIAEGMKLLQYDYLGGSGSRGYGRIAFRELNVNAVYGKEELGEEILQACQEALNVVEKDRIEENSDSHDEK